MFHNFNHRGDVVLITDGRGEIVKSLNYGAYGDVVCEEGGIMQTGPRSDSSMPEVFGGAYGIRRDTTTGLDYMRFRWYANDLSSFISADRVRGTNRYAYAKGNPVKYVDPMGLWTIHGVYNYLITIGAQEYADLLINYTVQPNGNIQLANGIQISPDYSIVDPSDDNPNFIIAHVNTDNKDNIEVSSWLPNEIASYVIMEEINHVLFLKKHKLHSNNICKQDQIRMEYLAKLDIAKYYKPISTKQLKVDVQETKRVFLLKFKDYNVNDFNNWLQSNNNDLRNQIFKTYVSLVWIHSVSQPAELMELIYYYYGNTED